MNKYTYCLLSKFFIQFGVQGLHSANIFLWAPLEGLLCLANQRAWLVSISTMLGYPLLNHIFLTSIFNNYSLTLR